MAIVTMKRLHLVAAQQDRDALFLALQKLGCVEVAEVTEALCDGVVPIADDAADPGRFTGAQYEQALSILRRYAPKKKGFLTARPTVTETVLFSEENAAAAQAAAEKLLEIQKRITALQQERGKCESALSSLLPWASYEPPLELTGTESTVLFLGTMSTNAVKTQLAPLEESLEGLVRCEVISGDKSNSYLAVLAHRSVASEADSALKAQGFSRTVFRGMEGTAAQNIARLDGRIAAIGDEIAAQEDEAAAMAGSHDALQMALDRCAVLARREEARSRLWTTEETFLLSGWFVAKEEPAVRALLEQYGCAYEIEEPTPEEYGDVPVLLKNNKFTGPLNMVTDMYALPAYGTLDPNPLMAPFFILFYGFMMADMGYGLLMMLASWVVQKKTKPNGATMRHLVPLLGLCGISTFIMGALTGGFFGDLIPQLVKMISGREIALPALFSPLDDALAVLIGSLALGVVQIFTGMGINMYKKIRQGQTMDALCNEGAWFVVFAVAIVGILLGQVKIALIAIAVVLVLTQGYGKKGIIGKLMGIGGSLYNNITGYFSDILSYSRLMALMLAGAVIAQVFNTLGAITGNVILFFLISAVGNALNFALNLLGCYVHDMRLQCLEFFGRFYEDGGRAFRPLNFDTQYVDIINHNKES